MINQTPYNSFMWESNRNLNATAEETQSQVWPQWCQIEVQTYWQFHLPIFHWSVKQIFLPQIHSTFWVDVLCHLYIATVFIIFRISSYKWVSYRWSSHWECLLWSERNCSRCPFAVLVWFHTQFDTTVYSCNTKGCSFRNTVLGP